MQEQLLDLGDVSGLGNDIEQNHRLAAARVAEAHAKAPLSVAVGGSHDHGFSHLKGLSERFQKIGCINLDAHFDVRKPEPKITSGSPFYLAIESGVLDPGRLIEFGIQRHCNAMELWDYIAAKKVQTIPFEQLRHDQAVKRFKQCLSELASRCDAIAISLDLDAVAQAYAPGVSAPQAEGFTSGEVIEMMELAGGEKKVSSLGIFELNPEHDVDLRTARLAATAAYHFVAEALRRSGG